MELLRLPKIVRLEMPNLGLRVEGGVQLPAANQLTYVDLSGNMINGKVEVQVLNSRLAGFY